MALSAPVPSSTMSATMRGQAFLVGRIGAGAAFDLQHERDDRNARMLDRPHLKAVRQPVPHDLGKGERRIRPDVGQPRSVDARHDTETGSEPASASAGWPRGITLRTTRASRRR